MHKLTQVNLNSCIKGIKYIYIYMETENSYHT